jgi:hypothetical protein
MYQHRDSFCFLGLFPDSFLGLFGNMILLSLLTDKTPKGGGDILAEEVAAVWAGGVH